MNKKTLMTAAVFGLTLACASAVNAGADTAVHRYSFNGNVNDSIGGADGSFEGGVATYSNGRLLLNGGGQYVSVGSMQGTMQNLTTYTFEAWFVDNGSSLYAGIFSAGDSGEGKYAVLAPNSPQGGAGYFIGEDGSAYAVQTNFVPGGLTHVAVVVSGDFGQLYVNGNQLGNGEILADLSGFGRWPNLFIGRSAANPSNPSGDNRFMNGELDEVRIYDYALSGSQIQDNFAEGPNEGMVNLARFYVDATRPPGGDGAEWATAFNRLEDALALTDDGDEVWVADGTYTPTTSSDRNKTFQINRAVSVYGGFAGSETTLLGRAGLFDQTILSGFIGGGQRAYHVVSMETDGAPLGDARLIDGFRITGGFADGASAAGFGGGLYLTGATDAVVRNCTIDGNHANHGGGLWLQVLNTGAVESCVFQGNTAAGRGGGAVAAGSAVTFSGCTFTSNNAADLGGAMATMGLNGPLSITGCAFSTNSANNGGGAVLVEGPIGVTMTSPVFTANSSLASGGAIHCTTTQLMTVTGGVFLNNTSTGHGGAVYCVSALSFFETCDFTGNSSTIGGAISDQSGVEFALLSCTFQSNSAQSGGALRTDSSLTDLSLCTFTGNNATTVGGAVMHTGAGASVISVFNCNYDANSAAEGTGGAIYTAGERLELTGCNFTGNAGAQGGAVHSIGGEMTYTSCTFDSNFTNVSAVARRGGALRNEDCLVRAFDCLFQGNSSLQSGGAIANRNTLASSQFLRCRFLGNTAEVNGGAVIMNGNAKGSFVNCLFGSNAATTASAGAMELGGGGGEIIDVINCSFADNTAATTGGGIVFNGAAPGLDVTIANCLLWDNTDAGGSDESAQMHVLVSATGLQITHALVQGWTGNLGDATSFGGDPILDDPHFDTGAGDYSVLGDSPAIDSGTGLAPHIGDDPIDLLGSNRFRDGRCGLASVENGLNCELATELTVDIGCYENGCWILTWQGEGVFPDCNANDLPDACEALLLRAVLDQLDGSTGEFRDAAFPTYQTMVSIYGRPWQAGENQVPAVETLGSFNEPSEVLHALTSATLCDPLYDEILREAYGFEMLLANEAFADAIDPTIGFITDGSGTIDLANVGEFHAFRGLPGINTLLDEELALLRGREIPLPADGVPFVDDSGPDGNYPQFGNESVAVYNRLRPNADGATFDRLAYISAYGPAVDGGIVNNEVAAIAFPQGHGDAYGYYLSAMKVYLDAFADDIYVAMTVAAQIEDVEDVDLDGGGTTAVPFLAVRNLAGAMAARSRAASQIVDRTFRRDYDESAADATVVLHDNDADRAWRMGDWATRAGLGAYLDWATLNYLLLEDDGTSAVEDVHRGTVDEIGMLAGSGREMQGRVDAAGNGRDPLGLTANTVPFGIDPDQLQNFVEDLGNGNSHYGQVRQAAVSAMRSAEVIMKWANKSGERMRGDNEEVDSFELWVEEREWDLNTRLAEIYGLPSIDDPYDNDLDGVNGADEDDSEGGANPFDPADPGRPDLVNYILTDNDLANLGWSSRVAPGEIQLALGARKVAALNIAQAGASLTALRGQIEDVRDYIVFRGERTQELLQITWQAGGMQRDLLTQMEDIKLAEVAIDESSTESAIFGGMLGAASSCIGGGFGGCAGHVLIGGAQGYMDDMQARADAAAAAETIAGTYSVQRQQQAVNDWHDAEIIGVEGDIAVEEAKLELMALIRQTPILVIELDIARQEYREAVDRLAGAVQEGRRLQAERDRIRRIRTNQIQQHRWQDLAFRVFRNNALQKYRAFYDIAARYVMLAAKSFAYEYNERALVEDQLGDFHRELRLGTAELDGDDIVAYNGGLWSVLGQLDDHIDFDLSGGFTVDPSTKTFSIRQNLLGLPNDPNDVAAYEAGSLAFRSWLEEQIVQKLQNLPEAKTFAQLSVADDFGPAIVIPLSTQITPGSNFFGRPVVLGGPYGGLNFDFGFRTHMMLDYQLMLDDVDIVALGGDARQGEVKSWLMPVGESFFREDGPPPVEDQPVRSWAVLDQNLRVFSAISGGIDGGTPDADVSELRYSPWVSLVNADGDFFNDIRRFVRSSAQVLTGDPGQVPIWNNDRIGRAVWNSNWLLAIPGGQWAAADDDEIRRALRIFVWGEDPNMPGEPAAPEEGLGITDIRWRIRSYRR